MVQSVITTDSDINKLGPDTGYDCINTYDCSAEMAQFLNALNAQMNFQKDNHLLS